MMSCNKESLGSYWLDRGMLVSAVAVTDTKKQMVTAGSRAAGTRCRLDEIAAKERPAVGKSLSFGSAQTVMARAM